MKQADNTMVVHIKRNVIENLMAQREWTIDELLSRLQVKYGIGIKYKGFAQLLQNKSTWKLIYAYALCDYFDMKIQELFELK